MRFLTITTLTVAVRLIALAIAKPIPNCQWKAGGIAIPLVRHSSSPSSNKSIDLDAISSHAISVRGKILRGLDNYETNTGTMHPFAMRRSESGLGRRGPGVPLTGSDLNDIWMGEISIGTPPKTLKVQIDTGSADMWVLQTGCDGIAEDRNLWDPRLSTTSKCQGRPFELKYEDGTIVQGDRCTDNVTIGGFTANPQTFGSVTSYTSPVQDNGYVDGLLGLAFPSISKLGVDPLFGSLVIQNRLMNLMAFSLKLTPSGAELYVGGANRELYKGEIAYTRVTTPGYWQVSMDDVSVDGKKILKNVPVMFDTGSAYIFGDWNRVAEFYKALGGTLDEDESLGYYYLPCDSFPTVIFTFGDTQFQIHPDDLNIGLVEEDSPNCFSAIVGDHLYATDGVGSWTIGTTFLKGIYTVFDYGNLRVGFAQLA